MPVKCSRCISKNLECRVLPDSDQCGECARSTGRASCDVYGNSASSWESVRREEARLEAEEEAAAQQEQEAFARRMRLRKQQKVLKEKAGKMLQHDLHTIDALEEFEEKERLEKERAEQAAQAAPTASSSEVDPSLFELPPMSDSELAVWLANEDFSGGNLPSPLDSSGS
jgi:hypothetical protein